MKMIAMIFCAVFAFPALAGQVQQGTSADFIQEFEIRSRIEILKFLQIAPTVAQEFLNHQIAFDVPPVSAISVVMTDVDRPEALTKCEVKVILKTAKDGRTGRAIRVKPLTYAQSCDEVRKSTEFRL